ncbi:MAG TPA: SDR family NAD(P)-dependent oxidoreductase, partial [Casimicrobiaceae bacterium]|nr:SDR family NAD(P)-dependent oxidoreductase [Casimicrobiaceae bacterium]
MPLALITGANRGLGLEFTRQYRRDGWRVIGCCRDPDAAHELASAGAEVMKLDVTQAADVSAA